MAVPAHDTRDFEFAKKFNLPIIQVVQPNDPKIDWQNFTDDGVAVNSGFINGLPTGEAKKKITAWLEEKGLGKKTVNFKLRDWLFRPPALLGRTLPDHLETRRRWKSSARSLAGKRVAGDAAGIDGLQADRLRRTATRPRQGLGCLAGWFHSRDQHHAAMGRQLLVLFALSRREK